MHKFDLKCVAVQQMFINEYEHLHGKNEREDIHFVYGAPSLALCMYVCIYKNTAESKITDSPPLYKCRN